MKYKRMQGKILCVLILIVLMFSTAQLGFADTEVGGNITQDTNWTKANSPYIVTSTVQVLEAVKLIIEPGVTIKFDQDTGLTVGGELNAVGTEEEMIVFTSNQPELAPSDWAGIKFVADSVDAEFDINGTYVHGNIVRHAVIQYASIGIYAEYSSQYIVSNYIRYNDKGIYIHYCGSVIANNILTTNTSNAIQFRNHAVTENAEFKIIYLLAQNPVGL